MQNLDITLGIFPIGLQRNGIFYEHELTNLVTKYLGAIFYEFTIDTAVLYQTVFEGEKKRVMKCEYVKGEGWRVDDNKIHAYLPMMVAEFKKSDVDNIQDFFDSVTKAPKNGRDKTFFEDNLDVSYENRGEIVLSDPGTTSQGGGKKTKRKRKTRKTRKKRKTKKRRKTRKRRKNKQKR